MPKDQSLTRDLQLFLHNSAHEPTNRRKHELLVGGTEQTEGCSLAAVVHLKPVSPEKYRLNVLALEAEHDESPWMLQAWRLLCGGRIQTVEDVHHLGVGRRLRLVPDVKHRRADEKLGEHSRALRGGGATVDLPQCGQGVHGRRGGDQGGGWGQATCTWTEPEQRDQWASVTKRVLLKTH